MEQIRALFRSIVRAALPYFTLPWTGAAEDKTISPIFTPKPPFYPPLLPSPPRAEEDGGIQSDTMHRPALVRPWFSN